jgi:uncharacterized protein
MTRARSADDMAHPARECPGCQAKMKAFPAGKVELDRCTFCRGLWFDGGELEAVLGKPVAPEFEAGQTSRRCAGCRVVLVPAVLGGLRIEVCRQCRGVFLDEGELKALNAGKAVKVQQAAPEEKVRDDVKDWLSSLGV